MIPHFVFPSSTGGHYEEAERTRDSASIGRASRRRDRRTAAQCRRALQGPRRGGCAPRRASRDPSDFSIGKADFFFDDTIPKRRLEELNALARKIEIREEEPRSLVFVREVPIRESLLHGSVPNWAAGARVDQSVGPFANKDGRRFWFDFYPRGEADRLVRAGDRRAGVALQVWAREGRQRHRFQTRQGKRVDQCALPDHGRTRGLVRRFDHCRRPDCGERDSFDRVRILTVPANARVSVQLELAQSPVTNADPASPYGADARDLQLDLPGSFAFHFSAQGHAIDAVGDARWELYGQELHFTRRANDAATYDPFLQRVLVPFAPSEEEVRIRRARSEFHILGGTAGIVRSAWALPVAAIDITQPPEAQGTGAMLVQTNQGLFDAWPKLLGGPLNLAQPAFLVSPGSILLADFTNGNPHARQSFQLWRHESNKFASSVELTFPFPALFVYASDASGVELFTTFANADFRVDRPVKVNGEPPSVRSLYSLLIVAASSAGRLVYLFDDNLLQDASKPGTNTVAQPIALALTNALFKVTHPNGALLSDAVRGLRQG